jgi:hypothetical protein
MTGAQRRLIKSMGTEYDVKNASQGSNTRDLNSYETVGTLMAVIREETRPTRASDSAGEDIEATEELRAIVPDTISLYEPGHSSQLPTRFDHPANSRLTYELVGRRYEDAPGVDVLPVVRV